MWPVNGTPVSPDWLRLEPMTVLYDLDGPRIFVCADAAGEKLLAYQCGEADRTMRFLVVSTDDSRLRQLTQGEDSLRDALDGDPAWLIDIAFDWRPVAAWSVHVGDIPDDRLPDPDVMLWSHLPPRTLTPAAAVP